MPLTLDDTPQTQDFSPSAGSLQDEVTVTATKGLRSTAEIPQVVAIVTANDIEAINRTVHGLQTRTAVHVCYGYPKKHRREKSKSGLSTGAQSAGSEQH